MFGIFFFFFAVRGGTLPLCTSSGYATGCNENWDSTVFTHAKLLDHKFNSEDIIILDKDEGALREE